jgi:hypothetical protein
MLVFKYKQRGSGFDNISKMKSFPDRTRQLNPRSAPLMLRPTSACVGSTINLTSNPNPWANPCYINQRMITWQRNFAARLDRYMRVPADTIAAKKERAVEGLSQLR